MNNIIIENCTVGSGCPTFIVAEIGQGHDGSLGLAHSYIDSVADAGADAIKFQTHLAAEESTTDDVFRVNFSRQDETRYDYWKRMEFSPEQWKGLADHARQRQLIFLSSAFSVDALTMLVDLGMKVVKVASGEVSHMLFMEKVCDSDLPVFLSTGMSAWTEIDKTLKLLVQKNIPVVVMQCTSQYPTGLEKIGLNILQEFTDRYDVLVGLSDHSGLVYPGLVAIARNVSVLEVHVSFNKQMFGPDTSSSITIDNLQFIVEFRDSVHEMNINPVDKNEVASELSELRTMFSRSLALKERLKSGSPLKKTDLIEKKPGFGIHVDQIDQIVGRRLKSDVEATRLLRWEDLDD